MISALLAPLMAITRERGQNAGELLAKAGLQSSDLKNPEKPNPEDACLHLWTLTAHALSDPALTPDWALSTLPAKLTFT